MTNVVLVIAGLVAIAAGVCLVLWGKRLDHRFEKREAQVSLLPLGTFRGPSWTYTGGMLILLGGLLVVLGFLSRGPPTSTHWVLMNVFYAVIGTAMIILGLRRIFMLESRTAANVERSHRLRTRVPWLDPLSQFWLGGGRARGFTLWTGFVFLVGGIFLWVHVFVRG